MKTVKNVQFGPVIGEITDLGSKAQRRYRVDVGSHLSNTQRQIFTADWERAKSEMVRAVEELQAQIATYPQ